MSKLEFMGVVNLILLWTFAWFWLGHHLGWERAIKNSDKCVSCGGTWAKHRNGCYYD